MTTSEPKGRLHDLVVCDDRRNTKATVTTITLRNQALADRQRPERSRFQLAPQLHKELLHATRFDVAASVGIDAGCP
ncbi:MAG: hypothetical protein LC777_13180 [Actinobacteria bacterium]|nr:hypothetical protein [Actinomycetota bacterium]